MSSADQNRAASIRQRLRNHLRDRGEDVQFGLQRYAVERFLYRLGESPHRDRFVLKGAALFALWGGALYRATRDLDFSGYGNPHETEVLAALRDICTHPSPNDGLVFDSAILTAEPIRDESDYHGLRLRLEAKLGSSRIPMQIDIGFGNAIEPPPQAVTYPTLLDDPPPRIQAYPLEAVVAEKLHAMVLPGERNSRYKDFHDCFVLARQFCFDGVRLTRSIAATFERRRTATDAALPVALTPRFFAGEARAEQWRAYLTRNSLPGAPVDFAAVGQLLQAFLGPVWRGLAAEVALDSAWPPGGPWQTQSLSGAEQRQMAETTHVRVPAALRHGRRYTEYKESGVAWLGDVPAHWQVKRIKHLAVLNPEALQEDTDPALEMVYVDIGGVDSLGRIVGREQLTFASAPSRARRLVREGDVIVSTVRT